MSKKLDCDCGREDGKHTGLNCGVPLNDRGVNEARDRLRRMAQNEATYFAMRDQLRDKNAELEQLRTQFARAENTIRVLDNALDVLGYKPDSYMKATISDYRVTVSGDVKQ